MFKYFFLMIRFALLAGILPVTVYAQGEADVLKLSDYLNQIQTGDPTVEASRFRWEASKAVIPAAGALPDPNVRYGYFLANVETRVGAMNQKVGVSQKIPYPKKLRLERDLAKGRSTLAYWEHLNLLRHRITLGKTAYIDLAYVDEHERIIQQQLKLVKEMIVNVQAGFETNRNDLSDLLFVKQRQSNLEAKLIGLKGEREAKVATINRLRGAPATREAGVANYYEVSPLPDREMLLAHAQANSELLRIGIAATAMADDELSLARAQDLPDVTFGFDYTQINRSTFSSPADDGKDAVMAYFSVNIPIWRGKYDAIESRARKRLSSARAHERAVRGDIVMATVQAWSRADSTLKQIGVYEGTLIPQAQQAYVSTVSAFASGKASSIKWIEAQKGVLNAKLRLALLQADYLKAIAELERVTAINLSLIDTTKNK